MPPTKPPPPSMTLALDNCDSFASESDVATDSYRCCQSGCGHCFIYCFSRRNQNLDVLPNLHQYVTVVL